MTLPRRYFLAFVLALVGHGAILFFVRPSTADTAAEFGLGMSAESIEVALVILQEPTPDPASFHEPPITGEIVEDSPEPEPTLPPEPSQTAEMTLADPMPPEPEPETVVPVAPAAPIAVEPTPALTPGARPVRVRVAPAARARPTSSLLGSGPSTGAPGIGGRVAGVGAPADTRPGYLSNPHPPYPAESRGAGEEGSVQLTVQVDARGRALSVTVERSSGFARLDRAAIEAVRRWRFRPATRAGMPVAASVTVPVRFRLN